MPMQSTPFLYVAKLYIICHNDVYNKKEGFYMKILNDQKRLDTYIKKYHITSFFTKNMTANMKLFFYESGEYIYLEEDYLHHFFFLVDGKAKVFNTLANGKSHLLSFYEPLNVLGDVEIINNEPITVNVKTITAVYCIGISIECIKENALQDPLFLQFLCTHLGHKLNRCSTNSSINLLYPLENRLASYILAITTPELCSNNTLTFYDSLTEISELLGTSYRHLLRVIHDFTKKGILCKGPNGYEVINKAPLLKIASDVYRN